MKALFRIVTVVGVLLATAGHGWAPPPAFRPPPRPVMPRPRPAFEPGFRPAEPAFRPGVGGRSRPGFEVEPGRMYRDPISPDVVHARIGNQIKSGQPGQALHTLGVEGHVLSQGARVELTRQAVNELIARVDTAKSPTASLDTVRQARAQVRNFDAHSDRILAALEARLEHQGLVETVKQVDELGQASHWDQAGVAAGQRLRQPNVPREVAQTLGEVVKIGERVQTLDRVQHALKAAETNHFVEAFKAWREVDTARLPETVRPAATALRASAELRMAGEVSWRSPPDVARIKQSLADFQSQAGDRALTGRIQQDLAVKAFLDGFPREARSLLPADGPPEHAGNLLRDLKAMVLGEGQVGTAPAQRALEPGANGPGTPDLPPGLRSLIPEGQQQGWRPPVRESARAGLPPLEGEAKSPAKEAAPLEEAARREIPWRSQLNTFLTTERADTQRHGTTILHMVHAWQQQNQQADDDDRKLLADVEARLGRKLTAAERALAWQMRRQGKSAADIVAELDKAGRIQLDSADAYVRRGNTLLKQKEYDKALADYDEAIRLDPTDADAHLGRGAALTKKREDDKALAAFARSIELDPDNAAAYRHRGNAYVRKREYDKALADFDRAIRLAPENVRGYCDRGYVYTWKDEFDKALADFARAIELDPRNVAAYRGRGDVYHWKSDYDKALAAYAKALELDPKDAETYRARGDVYLWQCEYDKAQADFDRAIRLDPKQPEGYVGRGDTYAHKKDFDKALADYNRALELAPKDPAALVGRGSLYRKTGRYGSALADFNQALAIDAKSAEAHSALAWLLATCPEDELRAGAKALEHARRAMELTSQKEYGNFEEMAAAHAEIGQFKEAVIWQRKAVEARDIPRDAREKVRTRLKLYEEGKPYREEPQVKKGPGK